MASFNNALHTVADYLALDAKALVAAADDAPVFEHTVFGGMSVDIEEAAFLYALVRVLKPERALEIGAFAGVSADHILAALTDNKQGDLVSVDVADQSLPSKPRWTYQIADATTADLPGADFVFEDSAHDMPSATVILEKVKALNPRVVVSHDYYSDELYSDPVGFQVRQAFEAVFGAENVLGVKWDSSLRGFGIWRNPDWQTPDVEATPAPAKKAAPKKATAGK